MYFVDKKYSRENERTDFLKMSDKDTPNKWRY
jgi:hypothetical protein